MTRVFGLTGGIASGKSTVGRRLAARGVPVVDADLIAREVVAAGSPGLSALVEAFGGGILGPSGELDRKALGALAFATPEGRARLNAITHPLIGEATRAAVARHEAALAPLVCYEAALLVENGLADAFRPLVVVAAPEAAQIDRARARDAATEAEVRARLAAQLPLADKVRVADHVLRNDRDLGALLERTDEVLDAILDALGLDPALYPRPAAPGP